MAVFGCDRVRDEPDVILVEPRFFGDERGFFMETYSCRDFAAFGIRDVFVQDNHSLSRGPVLRGLHMADPANYCCNNVANGIGLLGALLVCGVRRFIFSSTAAVYDEPDAMSITEEHPTRPVNIYEATKLMFEQVLEWYDRAYGLRYVSLRYFNAQALTIAGISERTTGRRRNWCPSCCRPPSDGGVGSVREVDVARLYLVMLRAKIHLGPRRLKVTVDCKQRHGSAVRREGPDPGGARLHLRGGAGGHRAGGRAGGFPWER